MSAEIPDNLDSTTNVKPTTGTSITDVLGYGKIAERVISVLEKAGFAYFKKRLARVDTDNEVYRITELAKAKKEDLRIQAESLKEYLPGFVPIEYHDGKITAVPILSNATNTPSNTQKFINSEDRRESNVLAIAAQAADSLAGETTLTDEQVETDWVARFLRISEDVSDAQMQALWARVLAGEIKNPNSYSLRSLEALKNLSKREAELFQSLAGRFIDFGHKIIMVPEIETEWKLNPLDLSILREAGLIDSGESVTFSFSNKGTEPVITECICGNRKIIISTPTGIKNMDMPVLLLTSVGSELATLTKTLANDDFLAKLESAMVVSGRSISISKMD